MKTCINSICTNKVLARGFCSSHYHKEFKHLDLNTCSIDNCEQVVRHGNALKCEYHRYSCAVENCLRISPYGLYCVMHRSRVEKDGEVGSVEAKRRTKGQGTDWHLDTNGYVVRNETVDGKRTNYKQHRVVMEEILGRSLLPGENIHHKDRNRSNNNPNNLELWVITQPAGGRPEDLVDWAREILKRYADDHSQNGHN